MQPAELDSPRAIAVDAESMTPSDQPKQPIGFIAPGDRGKQDFRGRVGTDLDPMRHH